ncbi:hypothetical protein SCALM49S_09718 [Streptomyces californicus]
MAVRPGRHPTASTAARAAGPHRGSTDMTDTMKALLLGRGPDWVLDGVPVPESGPGEVL